MKSPVVKDEQRAKSEEEKMSASTQQSEPPALNESLPSASKEEESSLTSTETQVRLCKVMPLHLRPSWANTPGKLIPSNSLVYFVTITKCCEAVLKKNIC